MTGTHMRKPRLPARFFLRNEALDNFIRDLPEVVIPIPEAALPETAEELQAKFSELGNLISLAIQRGFKIKLLANEAIFPMLDSFVEDCLSLARALEEGREGFESLNSGSEEVPDDLVSIPDSSGPLGSTKLVPRVEYGSEYSNWALHKLVTFPNPVLRNQETADFFSTLAEFGIIIKRCRGEIPKGISSVLSELRSSIPKNDLRNTATKPPKKRRRRHGRASINTNNM
jgi:hypothetical protein